MKYQFTIVTINRGPQLFFEVSVALCLQLKKTIILMRRKRNHLELVPQT
jgi:hypothetical protein